MKPRLRFPISFLVILILASSLNAQRGDESASVPFAKAPYQVGEFLTYSVSFSNFIDAAHVELFVAERGSFFSRDGLQLRAHVETTGVVSAALYSINNDYTSYVDPETGLPYRIQHVIREGARVSDSSTEYNQPVGTTAIPPKLRMGEFPGTYDLVSLLYRLRALPLTHDSKYYFNVRIDREEYQAELKVTDRQIIKTNVGSFNTIVTEVRVPGNGDANKYRIRIYFSDDERHVPVLVTARHKSGEIRAELAGSEFITPTQTTNPTPPTQPVTNPPITNPTGDGQPISGAPLPPELPFKAGEQLNFSVFLGTQPQAVGAASFQVRARAKYFNRDGLLLTVKAQTNASASRIFFANDQINSYVDPNTLLPFRTELNLIEGRNRTNQILTIDQDRGSAVTDKGTSIEIPVGTHDYVSVLYALRSFNLALSNNPAQPKRNAVTILVNNRTRTLFITSLRRQVIQLGTQQIPAIELSLTTDDPQPDKYALRLWVSDDRRRLPLRITATTQLGPVRADLSIIPVTRQ